MRATPATVTIKTPNSSRSKDLNKSDQIPINKEIAAPSVTAQNNIFTNLDKPFCALKLIKKINLDHDIHQAFF